MSELRWILVVFGVLLLAGIYAWGRRGNKQSADAEDAALLRTRPEPHLTSREAESPSFEHSFERPFESQGGEHSFEPQGEGDIAAEDADEALDALAMNAPSGHPRDPSPPRRGRVEPTLHDDDDAELTAELPASEPSSMDPAVSANGNIAKANANKASANTANAGASTGGAHGSIEAPTLTMSDTPPRRIERRKIIALRLAATSERFAGQQLRETLQAASLQYGKYSVFHRLHEDGTSIFSVASMVEPGTFDLEQMGTTRYPGVTLFAQLPGPVIGVQALQDLVACGKHLQSSLGGTLQDERGVPLTAHRIERLRQEIQDFEHAPGRDSAQRHSAVPPSH